MPAAFAWPLKDDKYNWYYESEPEPHMDGRRMYCPRGRVVGGSSSINGMAYVRGHALDYDRWAGNALPDWSYAHVLPYFKRAESRAKGGDDYRGADGPLHVSTGACSNPLYQAFIEAGVQAGYPFTEDMNGYQQEGFGAMDMTTHKGRRWSTAQAYLKPALARPNLSAAGGRPGDAHSIRRSTGCGGGVRHRRSPAHGARRPRGVAVRRRHQFAAAADALRCRRRR